MHDERLTALKALNFFKKKLGKNGIHREEVDKCVYNELCAIRPDLRSGTLK